MKDVSLNVVKGHYYSVQFLFHLQPISVFSYSISSVVFCIFSQSKSCFDSSSWSWICNQKLAPAEFLLPGPSCCRYALYSLVNSHCHPCLLWLVLQEKLEIWFLWRNLIRQCWPTLCKELSVQTLHKLLIFTTRSQDLLLIMFSVVFEKTGKFLCKKWLPFIYYTFIHYQLPMGYSWTQIYQLFGRLMPFI